MEDKAIRGVPWTLLSYAGSKVVSVGTTLVLARLVAPADFGLLALAMLATNFLSWIADMGVSGALVLRQDLTERDKGTLLTLMGLTGLLAAVIAVALSPLAAAVFHAPRLTGVVAVTALLLPLGSIAGFWEAVLQQRLEFRRRFMGMITQSVVTAAVSIVLAALGNGVWSLVFGAIAGVLAQVAVLIVITPDHVRPAFDVGLARSAFRSGRGFVGQGLAAYIRQQVDTVTVGAAFGARQLGFYSMANRFGDLVYWVLAHPVAMVTFPSFAKSVDVGDDIRPPFLRVLAMIALVACPIGIIMSACSEPFTRALFGTRWLPMAGPLAIMGLWAAVRQVDTTIGWLLNSVGRAGAAAWMSVFVLAPLIGGCVLAAEVGGLTAVACVPLADTLLSAAIGSALAKRFVELSYGAQWRAIRPAVVASAPTWLATWGIGRLLGPAHAVLALPLSVLVGLVVYACGVSLLAPGVLRETVVQVGRMVGRAPAAAGAA